MKKSARTGASTSQKTRQTKSFINVKMFEPVNRKFTISSESNSILADYTHYLSSENKRKFTEDSVIEALIEKLNEDKSFLNWMSAKSNSSNILKDIPESLS